MTLHDDPRTLFRSTFIALGLALVVLLVAVLPAEYGIDPTGIGGAVGFKRLSAGPDGPAPPVTSTLNEVHSLRVDWRLLALPFVDRTETSEGSYHTTKIAVPIEVANVTSVTARLDWGGNDTTAGARFDLHVVAPDGRDTPFVSADSMPGAPANATAVLVWRSVPLPQLDDGAAFIPLPAADLSASGNWTVEVRLLTGGAGPQPWRLRVTVEAYEADVHQAVGRSGDVVTLTLPPGGGIEYKFEMAEGAGLRYTWHSSGPVYWDLHGEETGASPDDATSHATGTAASDAGDYTAPFAGRHGWFWRNDGDSAVQIRLETTGAYVIVGVP